MYTQQDGKDSYSKEVDKKPELRSIIYRLSATGEEMGKTIMQIREKLSMIHSDSRLNNPSDKPEEPEADTMVQQLNKIVAGYNSHGYALQDILGHLNQIV